MINRYVRDHSPPSLWYEPPAILDEEEEALLDMMRESQDEDPTQDDFCLYEQVNWLPVFLRSRDK